MEGFVIFGYMLWMALTFIAWIVGPALLIVGLEDEDGQAAGIGVVFTLLAMLSTSFLLAGLD